MNANQTYTVLFSVPSVNPSTSLDYADGLVFLWTNADELMAVNPAGLEWRHQFTDPTNALFTEDVVYVPDGTGLHALNKASGEVMWSYALNLGVSIGFQPVLSDQTVYIVNATRILYALDALSGELMWELMVPAGVASDPIIINNTLYVGGGDTVYTFDLTDFSIQP